MSKDKEDRMDEVSEEMTSKKDKTFTEETKKTIDEARTLIKNSPNNLKTAVGLLLTLEKKTRLGADNDSTSQIVTEIVHECITCGDWAFLSENIINVSKKRAQSKMAIVKMVQSAMTYLDKTPNKAVKMTLLETLNKVTDGKIYVEIERSRIARMQAQLLEQEGKLVEAAEVLQDVQIETIGSMEAPEKIDFILYHFRLTLDAKDFVRAIIIARKITERSLSVPDHQDLKIEFFKLMIRYHVEKKSWIDIAKAYLSIYDTKKIKEDEKVYPEILTNIVLYLILSPWDNLSSDLMHRVFIDKKLDGLKMYKQLLKTFVSAELINPQAFDATFKQHLVDHAVFKADPSRWQELHNRIVENNIRVISVYYTRIHTKRLAALLHLDEQTTEDFVSKMVQKKIVIAKIDRIDGIVRFIKSKQPNDVLNAWSSDTNSLLGLVEKSVHLINKEMVSKVVKKDAMDLID